MKWKYLILIIGISTIIDGFGPIIGYPVDSLLELFHCNGYLGDPIESVRRVTSFECRLVDYHQEMAKDNMIIVGSVLVVISIIGGKIVKRHHNKLKNHLISIIVIAVVVVLASFFVNTYDFAPSTKYNPYGVEATIVEGVWYPSDNLGTGASLIYMLHLNSEKPVQFLGANVCSGLFCVKEYCTLPRCNIPFLNLGDNIDDWNQYSLTVYPWWKAGDTVNLRVKVMPINRTEDGGIISDDDKILLIDLGESKIIKKEYK